LTSTKYGGNINNCDAVTNCCNFSEFAPITCSGVSQKPCRTCNTGYNLVNGCCQPAQQLGNCVYDNLGNRGWDCVSDSDGD